MKLLQANVFPVLLSTLIFCSCSKSSTTPDAMPASESLTQFAGQIQFKGKIISNVTYGSNTTWLGQKQNLVLDIYFPTPEIPVTKTPLIVFFHGGGYVSGDKGSTANDCILLASKGYTVATINYRLGYPKYGNVICNPANSQGTLEAFYRGQQDARAALRYLVANADKYSIAKKWIFIEGESAGAGMALALAYFTQDSLDYYLPGIKDTLGLLDNEGNDLKNTFSIKGIASKWGGLLFTPNVITMANAEPTIFFQGMLDMVVPFNVGYTYSCDAFASSYGTKPLYDKTVSYGVAAVAHVDPQGIHGVYTPEFNEDNIACFFDAIIAKHPENGYYTTMVTNCR